MAFLLLNDQFQQDWAPQVNSWGFTRPKTEWWADTITAVKSAFPKIILLAEVYSPYEGVLQQLGFDYTYDKQFYDKLTNGDLDVLRGWISGQSVSYTSHSAHFVSNHDEQRAVSNFGSWDRAAAAALVTYTLPGLRFFWWGDFQGYKNQLDVHLRREQSEPVVPAAFPFYQRLLTIVNSPVFKLGTWKFVPVSNSESSWRLIAYQWSYQQQRRVCVLNFSDQQGWGDVVLGNASPVNGNDTVLVTDLMTGQVFYRSASGMRTLGLTVGINPWFGSIFEY